MGQWPDQAILLVFQVKHNLSNCVYLSRISRNCPEEKAMLIMAVVT